MGVDRLHGLRSFQGRGWLSCVADGLRPATAAHTALGSITRPFAKSSPPPRTNGGQRAVAIAAGGTSRGERLACRDRPAPRSTHYKTGAFRLTTVRHMAPILRRMCVARDWRFGTPPTTKWPQIDKLQPSRQASTAAASAAVRSPDRARPRSSIYRKRTMSERSPAAAEQAAYDFLFSRINYERTAAVPYRAREYKLDRMRELLTRLGDPQQRLPIVHVAGTKGKGSTCAILGTILAAAGYRVGTFSSPHLERVEERLAIDTVPCDTPTLVALIEQLRPVVAAMDAEARERDPREIGPTYFEITTALALMHFAASVVDIALLEVGLGGRLDSTNVCTPICAAITSISYDHMRQLGNTLAKIAREKAGIIKPGVPVVSGVTATEPRSVIREVAAAQGAELCELDRDFHVTYRPPVDDEAGLCGSIDFRGGCEDQDYRDLPLRLLGAHQARNAAVALAIIGYLRRDGWRIDDRAIASGLSEVRCRARVEVLSRRPTIVVDAAHNVASIESLLAVLEESFPAGPRRLVLATTLEKDVRGMLRCLLPRFDEVILTRYLNNPRAVSPEELGELARELGSTRVRLCPDPASAWQAVQEDLTPDHLVCVTGSFFIAAEMRQLIAAASVAENDQTAARRAEERGAVQANQARPARTWPS
ncbi:MAG: bifunctional folylpolyglutamate synthase/dihydrofolate synthase [Planctomycetota bacterium]|nr:MAG: bifunctional folylpolyglutamate synthase/dihydrofolate synthase [Planctomycetota bacterium]REK47618.1 MAG: bifunctional folylpolyglutamate synthase/dihydrofolate synthase [Planctomycetota bacterium]